jgi:hypothetical protein
MQMFIHMPKIAVSIYCYNCLLFVFDLFLCFVNHNHIFYALLLQNGFFFFLSVLDIIYVIDLESVLFDSKNVCNVLPLTCSISYSFVFICGSIEHKISISIVYTQQVCMPHIGIVVHYAGWVSNPSGTV